MNKYLQLLQNELRERRAEEAEERELKAERKIDVSCLYCHLKCKPS